MFDEFPRISINFPELGSKILVKRPMQGLTWPACWRTEPRHRVSYTRDSSAHISWAALSYSHPNCKPLAFEFTLPLGQISPYRPPCHTLGYVSCLPAAMKLPRTGSLQLEVALKSGGLSPTVASLEGRNMTCSMAKAFLVASRFVAPGVTGPRTGPEARAMVSATRREKMALRMPCQAPHRALVRSRHFRLHKTPDFKPFLSTPEDCGGKTNKRRNVPVCKV